MIVERWWKVPLAGEGRKPRLHRRHRIYKLVEDTKHRPKENLELILTQSVEGKAQAAVPALQALLAGITCPSTSPWGFAFCVFENINLICVKKKKPGKVLWL